MKKFFQLFSLSLLSLTLAYNSTLAQSVLTKGQVTANNNVHKSQKDFTREYDGSPYAPKSVVASTPVMTTRTRGSVTEIGTTTWDYQPDNQRIYSTADGKVAVTWTGSTWEGSLTDTSIDHFPDRGTFYNFFNGSTWTPSTGRLESKYSGYPTNVILANGKEFVASNNSGSSVLTTMTRASAGTGSWNKVDSSTLDVLWPRATASGNTLHVVGGHTRNAPSNYLWYSRSTDGGVTWDKLNVPLPLMDTADCIKMLVGHDYAIQSRGNTVAIVAGGARYNSLYLWKSTDNGDTWNRTTIWDIGICGLDRSTITDINSDGKGDSIQTADGNYTIAIDENDLVHTWFGYLLWKENDTTDNYITVYSGSGINGVVYWNETLADSLPVIGAALDLNEDAQLQIGMDNPFYTGGDYATMPTVSIDTTTTPNTLYLVFSAQVENTDAIGNPADEAAQSYSDLYGMFSTDGGQTWSKQANLTNTADDGPSAEENIYPSAAKYVRNGVVDVTWMADAEPGSSLLNSFKQKTDLVHTNKIYYKAFEVGEFTGIKPVAAAGKEALNIYPNPSNGLLNVKTDGFNGEKGTIYIENLIGQTVKTFGNVTLNNTMHIKAADLTDGMYVIRIKAGEKVMTGKFNISRN